MRVKIGLATAAAVAAALVAAAGAGASGVGQSVIPYQPGDPHTNGCPSGWEALYVADFPDVYHAPGFVDDPENGGNGDGIVCGQPWTSAEQSARLPNAVVPVVFNFEDNHLPAYSG
jgi:hypothetical protein